MFLVLSLVFFLYIGIFLLYKLKQLFLCCALSYTRYWKVDLWENLFSKLLNTGHANYHPTLLKDIRQSFEDYLHSNPQLIRKLKDLLVKLRASLCLA